MNEQTIKEMQANLARMRNELTTPAAKNIIKSWEDTIAEFQIGYVAGLYPPENLDDKSKAKGK